MNHPHASEPGDQPEPDRGGDPDSVPTPQDPPTAAFDPTEGSEVAETGRRAEPEATQDGPVPSGGAAPSEEPAVDEPAVEEPQTAAPQTEEPGAHLGLPGGYGGPSEPEEPRRSIAMIVVAVIAALALVAALVLGAIRIFGADQTPEAQEPPDVLGTTAPADEEAGTMAEDDEGDPDGEPAAGELYDYLTGQVDVVDGEQSVWTRDDQGWVPDQVSAQGVEESYRADFGSQDGERLTLRVVSFAQVPDSVEYGEQLVADRGEPDDTGQVWLPEETVEDDLELGVFNLYQNGSEIEVIWWDDRGMVRQLTGPDSGAWDFYLNAQL